MNVEDEMKLIIPVSSSVCVDAMAQEVTHNSLERTLPLSLLYATRDHFFHTLQHLTKVTISLLNIRQH